MIPSDRLREIAAADPVAVNYDTVREMAAELLAARAAKDMAEGEADAALDGEWFPDLCCAIFLLRNQRDEARQHHQNALSIAGHNIERVKHLDAKNKAQFETLDALRGLHDQLLAAVMDGTAEFREWQECEADAIEGQEAEVERDHNRMLAALHALRRKAEHVQNGTRAVVEAGSLPAHLERAEQPKPIEPAPCACCDKPASHIGSDGHQRCSEHTLKGDQPTGGV